MGLLGLLSDDLAHAWEIYYGDALDKVEDRGVEVSSVSDLCALVHVLDTVGILECAGFDPSEEFPEGVTRIDDISACFRERFDEDVLFDSAREYYDRRWPLEQALCEVVVQLFWSRVDPFASPSSTHYFRSGEDLRSSALLDDEPFDLYLSRAHWALSLVAPDMAGRLYSYVAVSAISFFGLPVSGLPLCLRSWAPLSPVALAAEVSSLRAASPLAWLTLEDMGCATLRAQRWLDGTGSALWPDSGGDRSVIPSLADILGSPHSAPIVLERSMMCTMMGLLLECYLGQPVREGRLAGSVSVYVRRFPMDFRAMFVLHVMNARGFSPLDQFDHEEAASLDAPALAYLKYRCVPLPRGLGRLGPVGE